MSKRKTRQQKIVADLKRKIEPQPLSSASSPSYQYSYSKQTRHIPVSHTASSLTLPISVLKHDLYKTISITGLILIFEIALWLVIK